MSVIDVLRDRGFVENTTHEKELYDYIESGSATCYIGFDPTASSFHVGSLIPIMALAHMQAHGHRPIALIGGGTGLVGDPSGKTEMRQLLSIEKVEENAVGLKDQLSRFSVLSFLGNMLRRRAWSMDHNSALRCSGGVFDHHNRVRAERNHASRSHRHCVPRRQTKRTPLSDPAFADNLQDHRFLVGGASSVRRAYSITIDY